jgi:hypothetical protein
MSNQKQCPNCNSYDVKTHTKVKAASMGSLLLVTGLLLYFAAPETVFYMFFGICLAIVGLYLLIEGIFFLKGNKAFCNACKLKFKF